MNEEIDLTGWESDDGWNDMGNPNENATSEMDNGNGTAADEEQSTETVTMADDGQIPNGQAAEQQQNPTTIACPYDLTMDAVCIFFIN
jgi:hypothetical protein